MANQSSCQSMAPLDEWLPLDIVGDTNKDFISAEELCEPNIYCFWGPITEQELNTRRKIRIDSDANPADSVHNDTDTTSESASGRPAADLKANQSLSEISCDPYHTMSSNSDQALGFDAQHSRLSSIDRPSTLTLPLLTSEMTKSSNDNQELNGMDKTLADDSLKANDLIDVESDRSTELAIEQSLKEIDCRSENHFCPTTVNEELILLAEESDEESASKENQISDGQESQPLEDIAETPPEVLVQINSSGLMDGSDAPNEGEEELPFSQLSMDLLNTHDVWSLSQEKTLQEIFEEYLQEPGFSQQSADFEDNATKD